MFTFRPKTYAKQNLFFSQNEGERCWQRCTVL